MTAPSDGPERSSPQPSLHAPPPSRWSPPWRQMWYFAIFSLVMNSTLILVYESVVTYFARRVAASSPELTTLLNTTIERFNSDSETFRTNETTLRDFLDQLSPISSQIDWFLVTLVSSLVAFSLLGFLYVRVTGRLDWAAAFPLVSILMGQNPNRLSLTLAEHGVQGAELSFPRQALVLAAQLLAVLLWGALARSLYRRHHPRPDESAN